MVMETAGKDSENGSAQFLVIESATIFVEDCLVRVYIRPYVEREYEFIYALQMHVG